MKLSFLKEYPVKVIHNGVDIEQFRILSGGIWKNLIDSDKKIVLGVANVWEVVKVLRIFQVLSPPFIFCIKRYYSLCKMKICVIDVGLF